MGKIDWEIIDKMVTKMEEMQRENIRYMEGLIKESQIESQRSMNEIQNEILISSEEHNKKMNKMV